MTLFLSIILAFVVIIALAIYLILNQAAMGAMPTGERLKRVLASPNYRDGEFQNLSPTPQITNEATYFTMLRDSLFNQNKRTRPSAALPSIKTDLKNLPKDKNTLIWMGHTSYFMQIDGKTYLMDPVLSGRASPVPFTVGSFAGTDIYTVDDLPAIDYLLISHDHWDHIDYPVIKQLQSKVGRVITGLGTGQHLVHWGYPESLITELDWYDSVDLDNGAKLIATPARHFSGRGLKRNQTLWLGFVLITPSTRLFISGDSGYDSHFKTIGERFGPFDLSILENGQYDKSWANIHSMPEETALAARELLTAAVLPVHWSKFKLALHDWDDPIERLIQAQIEGDPRLVTPMIGEPVYVGEFQSFSQWWRESK